MHKDYYYPFCIRFASIIIIVGQFCFVVVLIYLTIYLYPNPRATITVLLSVYFIYILVKAIRDLMDYFPNSISFVDGLLTAKFLFGKTKQVKIEDIISISVKCKNEPFYTTMKLRDNSIIGIGRSIMGRDEIINFILSENKNCKLIS